VRKINESKGGQATSDRSSVAVNFIIIEASFSDFVLQKNDFHNS